MTRIVTALYDTGPQAELALAHLNSEVGVEEGQIVDRSIAGRTKLAKVRLDPAERTACERELESGGYLLIARVDSAADPDRIVALLRDVPRDGLGKPNAAPPRGPGQFESFRVEDPKGAQPSAPAMQPPTPPPAPAPAPAKPPVAAQAEGFWVEDSKAPPLPPAAAASTASTPPQAPAEEQRIPIVEEELRIGKREVVRGGARVHASIIERPVREEIELASERTSVERRPAGRKLSEEELEAGGLLRERTIEISEMREEAVISKEAFVREELVVKKTVERRTETIDETVRHTEVQAERLPPGGDRPAFGGFASAPPQDRDGR